MITYHTANLDASNTFSAILTNVKRGHTVAYHSTHQAWYPVTVTIKDAAGQEYSKKTASGTHAEEVDHKIVQLGHDGLVLSVTFDRRCRLVKYCLIQDDIRTQDQSRIVGYHCTYCFEDSTDDDYNDLSVSFTIWYKGMEIS